eukprot:1963973-Amphidinium_carterae.1
MVMKEQKHNRRRANLKLLHKNHLLKFVDDICDDVEGLRRQTLFSMQQHASHARMQVVTLGWQSSGGMEAEMTSKQNV